MCVLWNCLRAAHLAALFLILLSPSWGQITLVHVTPCQAILLPGSACSIATSGAGNLLVVAVQMTGTTVSAVANMTDDARNQYSQAAGSRSIDANSGNSVEIWYAANSTAGATAVTITPTTSAIVGAVVWEFSGVDPGRPLDRAASYNSPGPVLSVAAPAVTTSFANEVLISVSAVQNSVAGSVSAGFTDDSSVLGGGWAHLITSASGTYTPTWTQSSPGTYASSTASFKAASPNTSCDINGDGAVNAVDVQLITNMEIGTPGFPCTVNIGGILQCSETARQVVIKAALVQGCHFISLNWNPSGSAGVIGYNIYRGTSSGGESLTPLNTGGPVSGTTFTDTTTVSGTTYYYVIKATDGSHQSPPSQEASATAL